MDPIEKAIAEQLLRMPKDRVMEIASRVDRVTLEFFCNVLERYIAEHYGIEDGYKEDITDLGAANDYLKRFMIGKGKK
jgi:uncharacterized protein YegJ (DUF2314 family)